MNGQEHERNDATTSYLQGLRGGNIDNGIVPGCPECGAAACGEHLDRWYYGSPDLRDEE